MKVSMLLAVYLSAAIIVLGGCTGREDAAPVSKSASQQTQNEAAAVAAKQGTVEETPITAKTSDVVTVPNNIKAGWKSVDIEAVSRQDNKKTVVSVPIGSQAVVAGTNLRIMVGNFVPDFVMEGERITSASNDLNNPAAHITVSEDGKEIYIGWIFAKYPAMNRFEHPNYALALTGYKR